MYFFGRQKHKKCLPFGARASRAAHGEVKREIVPAEPLAEGLLGAGRLKKRP